MKAALCLFVLCLAGYASSAQYAWKTGKQYTYHIQARLFSGVAINTQYAGLQVKYDVILTVTGPNKLHLNPTNFRAVELNSELKDGWRDGELENETPVDIKNQLKEYFESNIEVNMKEGGVIDSIQVQDNLPTWAVNIKKAQVSHFVLDTTGVNNVISGNMNRQTNSVRPEEANQESGFFYETMEETVHGECETYYTVSQNGAFDWPHQFQAQVQPGQQNEQSQEQNVNQNNRFQSRNQDSNESNESQQNQQDDSSEEQNGPAYQAYKSYAQRFDSGSAEDSHETRQGELPWPKEFATFCNQQDQVYEIIKTVNFTACRNKAVLAYSTNAGLHGRGGDNTIGSALQRAFVSRYLACGKDRKQYTILKIEQEEQVNFGLRVDQKTFAGTVQNITLKSVDNAQQVEPVPHPKTIQDLTYTFDPKEQQLQREGKLQHASYDTFGENENSNEESQKRRTTTRRPPQSSQESDSDSQEDSQEQGNRQNSRRNNRHQNKSRRPRSVSSDEQDQDSQQSDESEESQERAYKTAAEGADTLRHPSLQNPPLNPYLVSPLQSSGMQNRVQVLMQEIVRDITNDKEPMAESETLSKISTVAKIIRYLNAQDIQNLYHKIAAKTQTEEDQVARNVFLDAVAIAGTNPAIYTLMKLIKNQEITGEQANQLVMTFPMYIRTPTKELIQEHFDLVESPAVEKSLQLKTTALLSFSNILYQANVNLRIKNSRYPVAQYGEFGNQNDVQRDYVPYFVKNLEEYLQKEQSEGNNKHWTITYLAAFGNLGVRDIVPQVQKVLDDSDDGYVKTQAILALSRVIVSRQSQNIPVSEIHGQDRNGQDALTDEVVEKEVMPVLISAAFDKGEHPEVRMAAISLLLYTTSADVAVWQQLAFLTWFEPSNEVHSFIYSSFKSLAYLEQNVPYIHWQMQRNARSVLAIAKPITPGYAKSRNSFAAGVAEHLQSNYIHQFSYFGSKDSNVPNYIFYKNLVQYGNNAISVSPVQFTVHGHTIQKLATYVLDQYRKNSQNDEAAHRDIQQIYQVLGIERRDQTEDIEGSFNLKLRDEMQRIWSANEEVIEQFVKKAKEQGLSKLLAGIPFNYQKTIHAAEQSFEMPSAFGTPIAFHYRMPVHISLRGNVKLNAENNYRDFQVQVEVHPVYAAKTHHRVSHKCPLTGKKYQAGVQRHFVVEAPFRASFRKAQEGQVVVAFTPTHLTKGAPSGQIPLATYHQKPYTAIITDSLWPTTHKEGGQMTISHVSQQQQYKQQRTFGQQAFGFKFQTEEVSEYRQQNERSSGWIKFWQRFHSPTCFFQLGWYGGEKVRYVERSLTLDIQNSETKTLAFVFAGKFQRSASAKDLWQDSESKSSQSTEEDNTSDSAQQNGSSQQQNSNEQSQSSEQGSGHRRRQQNDVAATHSAEDLSQGGYIFAAAVIGKRVPLRPPQQGQNQIQRILQKGTPSTVQYLAQFSRSNGRVYFRAASGDAANEAAKKLPQSSKSLQALREAIVESPNTKAQPDACVDFEGEYDAPSHANRGELLVLRKQLLQQDLEVKIKAEVQFGRSCSKMPYEIKAQGKLQRGPQMTEYAQTKSRQAQRCTEDEKKGFYVSPVCMWVADQQAAALNQGEFNFVFTQMPKAFTNGSDDVEDFAKALLYPYYSYNRFHEGTGEGKLQVQFHLTPNKEFLDVHIVKPHSKMSFRSIRTNRAIRTFLPFTATQSLAKNIRDRALRADSQPSCSVQGFYANTFDNVTLRFSEQAGQGCYHVLAQDCSARQPISVLVRDISTNQKKVVILLPGKTKISLTPREGNQRQNVLGNAQLQVEINEQRVESLPRAVRSSQDGQVIAQIEQMHNGGIQVFTEHMDIAANGKYVVVYASNYLRNNTCGICGDFNGEKVADMKSPQNCPLSSGSALVASYAMKPQLFGSSEKGECKINPQLQKQVRQENTQCLNDNNNYYSRNNSQLAAQNNELGAPTVDCVDKLKSVIRNVVYKVVNTVLKPFVWNADKRHKIANTLADKVANKVADFLKEGGAKKIAQAIVSFVCQAMKLLPVPQIDKVCSLLKPVLVKGLLYVINPICKKTGCCTPSLSEFSPAEFEQFMAFKLDDEPLEVDEHLEIPYLSKSEATKSCKRQLEKVLPRAMAHIVHALLQPERHMSEFKIQRIVRKSYKESTLAIKKALKRGENLITAVVQAIERTMPSNNISQQTIDKQLLRESARAILDLLCSERKCCFPGQY